MTELETLVARTQRTWPFLSAEHARRLASAYGTRMQQILGPMPAPWPIWAGISATGSMSVKCAT